MSDTVLVSGASGFIAQHIVKLLVSKGYKVVGTVRSSAKGDKLQKNLDSVVAGRFTYCVVPDIAETGAFDDVFTEHTDISVVLHTASPFFYNTSDPEADLVLPAIRGTDNMMKAVQRFVAGGNVVKRVVVTSSDAAIYSADDEQNSSLSFDERSWNNISYEDAIKDPINAYYGAKSFAEKAVWAYAKSAEFPPVTAVNPVYVFGPQAFDNEVSGTLNTSNELINSLLKSGPSGHFDNDKGGFIDVRDVARAHWAAFADQNTVGKRLYMTNGKFSVQMMLDVINRNFGQLRGKVPVGNEGSGPQDISQLAQTHNETTRDLLGFNFIPLEKCVTDVVAQILHQRVGSERL